MDTIKPTRDRRRWVPRNLLRGLLDLIPDVMLTLNLSAWILDQVLDLNIRIRRDITGRHLYRTPL
jgi:hypothetical protein